jgi:glycosyltransferase involved in cell wall biosynthesis
MAIHNGERFLAEAVSTLIEQTMEDWELVAVLDGCTDRSETILREFSDRRIRIVPLGEPGGFARALNLGLGECRAELVARLDHDDGCLPARLERQSTVLTNRSYLTALGSSAQIINESSRVVGYRFVMTGVRAIRFGLLWRNQVMHSSVMFRRSAILALGGYDLRTAPMFADYDLWLRVIVHGEIDNLREPLVRYRRHRIQMSRSSRLSRIGLRTLGESRRQAAARLGIPWFVSDAFAGAWLLAQVRHELLATARRGHPASV